MPGHPPGGDPQAGELAQQQRRPVNGDVMPGREVSGLRAGLRPVAGPRPHVRRQLPLSDRPAARALLRLRHVLGHLRRRRRLDIGDLVAALGRHRLPVQARAAAAARRRRVLQPLVRVINELHRRSRLARLLPRPPFSPLPQGPVPRLLLIRAVRRRRPRRCRRILPHLPFELLNPRGQLRDQPVRLRQPRRQLSMRQRRKLLRRGHTGHVGHNRQSSPSRPASQQPATACRGHPAAPIPQPAIMSDPVEGCERPAR